MAIGKRAGNMVASAGNGMRSSAEYECSADEGNRGFIKECFESESPPNV
jgi:hypothetical protein